MKKVTIQDIADSLGISRNTVSKAINNSGGLAEATRERILQKAVEMNYKQFSYVADRSSLMGRRIEKQESSGEIALLTATLFDQTSHFAVPTLDNLKQELKQIGYTLNTYLLSREAVTRRELPRDLDKDKVKGVIFIEMFDKAYGEMVCSLGLPVLFIDGPCKRGGYALPADQIYMDNTTGISALVTDMIKRGKSRIGFIGDYEHCQSFYERYLAFRCAMEMEGVPVNEAYNIKDTRDGLVDGLSQMASLPDLFICANDFIALDVLRVLHRLGKHVPEDVFLSGFDDAPESRIVTPALTTVHIHTQILAYTATDLLLSRMEEPELDYRTVHTQADLIYRDSTSY